MAKQAWQYTRIGKEYAFSAAHKLTKVPDWHPCARLHGHNYLVEVEVRGDVSERNGFCNGLDFADIDKDVKPVIEKLDHQFLNDFIENPTAERIAQYILDEVYANSTRYLYSVKVWETPKCWAMVVNPDGLFHRVHKE